MKKNHLYIIAASAFWCFVIFVSIVSSFLVTKIIANVSTILNMQAKFQSRFAFQNFFNEGFAQKNIITRNIFNHTGEIPAEDLEYGKETEEKNFAAVPCSPASETLPVEVLGIIYTGDSKTNLVTVQDSDVEGADVYHEGNQILDHTGYSVYRIANPTSVEFRYGSKKICRSLVSPLPNVVQNSNGTFETATENSEEEGTNANAVVLTHDYVEQELGPGFSKILTTMRFSPSFADGQFEGFKVFSITAGSLFDKIGLMNGDVITEINNQKVSDPTKGFLIYNSFLYDSQITISAKRGTERVTRKVIIR